MALTPQQLYDKALFGVRGQAYACSSRDGKCAYTASAPGTHCAVGHALTPEMRAELQRLEANNVGVMVVCAKFPSIRTHLDYERNGNLLRALQSAHDALDAQLSASPSIYEVEMKGIAEQFGLTYTEPSA